MWEFIISIGLECHSWEYPQRDTQKSHNDPQNCYVVQELQKQNMTASFCQRIPLLEVQIPVSFVRRVVHLLLLIVNWRSASVFAIPYKYHRCLSSFYYNAIHLIITMKLKHWYCEFTWQSILHKHRNKGSIFLFVYFIFLFSIPTMDVFLSNKSESCFFQIIPFSYLFNLLFVCAFEHHNNGSRLRINNCDK